MNEKGNESKRRDTKRTTATRQMEAENKRRAGAYLTDNVVIVRQVVSVSLGSGRRGVAQFPYVWLGAVGRGGNREAIRLRLAALWAVLTAGRAGGGSKAEMYVRNLCVFLRCSALCDSHF